MSDMTVRPLQVGEHVKYVRKVVESEGESVRIGQTGEVVNVRDNTKAADEFGSVLVFVVMDETVLGDDDHIGLFRPEELERFHPEPFDLDDFVDAMTGAPATEVLADAAAAQDHGPLAAPLSDRTLAKVLSRPAYEPPSPTRDAIVEAALRWHTIRNANAEDVTPLALFDADDALNMAVKAHIAAVQS